MICSEVALRFSLKNSLHWLFQAPHAPCVFLNAGVNIEDYTMDVGRDLHIETRVIEVLTKFFGLWEACDARHMSELRPHDRPRLPHSQR
jgi:hypothetical protein